MMRTQPPGFRWLVGGFALIGAVALGWRYLTADDRGALVFALVCLVAAGYWLIVDSEPEHADSEPERADSTPERVDSEPERWDPER